ncbi:MAG: aldo/keto reductase [Oscillospiraceae bacterium]|nr:aldo/keto reductase [Oscillospiraceae bacterium]
MYQPNETRYDGMLYNRCGRSGVRLPFLSLGLWHNFGGNVPFENARQMVLGAFDLGITHFDLANNYGPPAGSAEETFGAILKKDLMPYRDELIISSKAGYYMWPGPYGEWGSKKNLIASCDQSLRRMGLDYVDIFYHHRPDPNTPLEETMDALATLVRQGKALYVGISNYHAADARRAFEILEGMGVHCLIHQPSYSMFNRWIEEDGLLDVLEEKGVGAICFSPLAQGLLTSRYFDGIPADSRAGGPSQFLKPEGVTPEKVAKAKKLNEIAASRGQSLSQMALCWCLRQKQVCSLIIGASRLSQIKENVGAAAHLDFTAEELAAIEEILQA